MNNQIQEFDKVLADIEEIKERGNFLPDVSTKEGYEKSKRFVLDVTTKCRKAIEGKHKELKAPILKIGKELDAKKKTLISMLEEIEQPHKLAYRSKDKEEKERKERFEADLDQKIQAIINVRNQVFGKSADEISGLIDEVGEIDTSHDFYHKAKDAEQARQDTLSILHNALIQQAQYEAQQVQLEEMRDRQQHNQNNEGDPIGSDCPEERKRPSALKDALVQWAMDNEIYLSALESLEDVLKSHGVEL